MTKFVRIEENFKGERKLTYEQRQSWFAKYRRQLLEGPTRAESRFYDILFELGLNYIPQKGLMMPPRFIIVDFYLPKPHKVCIEIDGNGHKARLQKHKDALRDAYIRRKGYRVIRFTNDEVLNQSEAIKNKLLDFIRTPSRPAGGKNC